MPKVSVIMSAYNAEKYLRPAIESILSQTFSDFELIITDDGSSDSTREIIKTYNDPRIILIENLKNLGVAASYNNAVKRAAGEYVARMDADDIARPYRFEKQVSFLNAHPEIAVCGGWARIHRDDGREYTDSYAREDGEIRFNMLLYNNFVHPAVMFRRSITSEQGLEYLQEYWPAEDYEFFSRVIRKNKTAILPEVLLDYRYHSQNATSTKNETQQKHTDRVRLNQIKYLAGELTPKDEQVYLSLFHKKNGGDRKFIDASLRVLSAIVTANSEKKYYEEKYLNPYIQSCWSYACKTVFSYGLQVYGSGLKKLGIQAGIADPVAQLLKAAKYALKKWLKK
jgi:glycosyltransferase involved in cell wall biosynthesis